MNTKETIGRYLDAVRERSDWESLVADDAKFTSFTSPVKEVPGKPGFVAATKRFYSKVASFEVRDLLIDDDSGVALTRYQVSDGRGGTFSSDVAEVFTVRDEKVTSLAIYFDTAPYPR